VLQVAEIDRVGSLQSVLVSGSSFIPFFKCSGKEKSKSEKLERSLQSPAKKGKAGVQGCLGTARAGGDREAAPKGLQMLTSVLSGRDHSGCSAPSSRLSRFSPNPQPPTQPTRADFFTLYSLSNRTDSPNSRRVRIVCCCFALYCTTGKSHSPRVCSHSPLEKYFGLRVSEHVPSRKSSPFLPLFQPPEPRVDHVTSEPTNTANMINSRD